jgi:hypothetical protein
MPCVTPKHHGRMTRRDLQMCAGSRRDNLTPKSQIPDPKSQPPLFHFSGTVFSSSRCSSASTLSVGSGVEIIFIADLVTAVAKSL